MIRVLVLAIENFRRRRRERRDPRFLFGDQVVLQLERLQRQDNYRAPVGK